MESTFHYSRDPGADPSDGPGAVERLADEFLERIRRGERPTVEDYVARHPEHAGPLRELLSALILVEDLKPRAGEFDDRTESGPLGPAGRAVERLGDYRILRELGRGGMGIVYEAEQESLGRRVALKVLAPWVGGNPQTILRFHREARSAAQLHHSNIVPVFGVGSVDGLHYYAMQFIRGSGLDQVLEEVRRIKRPEGAGGFGWRPDGGRRRDFGESATVVSRMLVSGAWDLRSEPPEHDSSADQAEVRGAPPDRAAALPGELDSTSSGDAAGRYARSVARIGVQAAEALEYAHSQGMLHRDIKPSNLLLDTQGNIWVTDFGLAKAAEDDDLTRTGDLIGTLRYMAPERFRGRCDARSDVYALGLALYELLALRPAFIAADRNRLIHQITQAEPPRLRQLVPRISRDLETVIHKAIERDPGDRYASAGQLAEDLRNWLGRKPIRARPSGPVERLAKWTRRNPLPATLVALIALIGTALVAAAGIGYVQVAESLARERRTSYFQRIALAERAWSSDDVGWAEEQLDGCRTEFRGWEWHYLKRLCHSDQLTLQVHSGLQPNPLAYSPDGTQLAVAGEAGSVTLLRRVGASWTPTATLPGHRDGVYSLAFSPNGARLATAGADGAIQVWDLRTAGPLYRDPPRHSGEALGVAFSPDGTALATCSGRYWQFGGQKAREGELQIRDAATGRMRHRLSGHVGTVHQAVFSPDGTRLASAGGDGRVKLWDAKTGEFLADLDGGDGGVTTVAFSPDGSRLASATLHGVWRIWDLATLQPLVTHREHDEQFLVVAFSPDGERLAAAGRGWSVGVWDASDGDRLLTFRGQDREVTGLAFSPDGLHLAASGFGGLLKIWAANQDQRALAARGAGPVLGVALDAAGRRLAAVGQDGGLSIFDAATGRPSPGPETPSRSYSSVAIDPSGSCVAVGDRRSGIVTLWEPATGRRLRALSNLDGGVTSLAFHPAGRLLASGDARGSVTLWEWGAGRIQSVYSAASGSRESPARLPITSLAFSPDGLRLAASHGDRRTIGTPGEVVVRELRQGRIVQVLRGHDGGISDLAYAPDGRSLATSSWDRSVRVWDADSGRCVQRFKIRGLIVWAVAYTPDGRRIAAADNIGRIMFWDAATGQEVLTLRAHTDRIYDLAFSGDGRLLASAGRDAAVRIWDATPLAPSPSGAR